MSAVKAKINHQGRLVVPAEIREATGIAPDSVVFVEAKGAGRFEVKTYEADLAEAQALVQRQIKGTESLADELIRERREEAARE
jgi:AbrB family looped-hinge helix DNA binding protein